MCIWMEVVTWDNPRTKIWYTISLLFHNKALTVYSISYHLLKIIPYIIFIENLCLKKYVNMYLVNNIHPFFIKSYKMCCKFDHWSGGCWGESCIDWCDFFIFLFYHWCSKITKLTLVDIYSCQVIWKTLQNLPALLFHIDCLWFLTSEDSRWASVGTKHKQVCVTWVNATSWLRVLIIIIYCKLEMVLVILALGCC